MKILKAKQIGYCYGVRRAAKMAREQASLDGKMVFTLGPLMHNPQEVKRLEGEGIVPIEPRSLSEILGQSLVLRSHGVSAELQAQAEALGIRVVDATCPYVKQPRRDLIEYGQEGRHVIIVGDSDHPEVLAQVSYATGPISVVEALDDLEKVPIDAKIGVVAQTTLNRTKFEEIVEAMAARHGDMKVADTICAETDLRQKECKELAKQSDAVVVVGGRNSANTCHLAALAEIIEPATYHIEKAEELTIPLPGSPEVVALCSGASTPDWIIAEVEARLREN